MGFVNSDHYCFIKSSLVDNLFGWSNGIQLSLNLVSGQGTHGSTCLPKFVHIGAVVYEI
jgi:hypothetical protein